MTTLQRISKILDTLGTKTGNLWRSGRSGKLTVGCGTFLLLCGVCFLCSFLYSLTPDGRESAARVAQQNTATAQAIALAQNTTATAQAENADATATQKAKPTSTSAPAATAPPTSNAGATSTTFVQTIAAQVTDVASTLTAQPANTNVPTLTAQNTTTPTAPSLSTQPGIGLAREKIQIPFQLLGFTFEQGAPIDGLDNYVGASTDSRANLQLLGPADNLKQAALTVFITRTDEQANRRAVLYLVGLLSAVFPDWKESADWLSDALQRASEGAPAALTRSNIQAQLTADQTLGAVQLIIDAAPSSVTNATPSSPRTPLPAATNPPTDGSNIDGPVGVCTTGCSVATPPAGCVIKGNVNSDGEKIYHVPGQQAYTKTQIIPEQGDAWFCTQAEARAAGFRAAER